MKRQTMIGGLLGIVGLGLAAGGIASAILNPSVTMPDNIISAGHLVVEVNQGQASGLDFGNLAPGDTRSADQLITGDLAGVSTAELAMTLAVPASGQPTEFLDNALLSVSYSEPTTVAGLGWTAATPECSIAATWTNAITAQSLSHLAAATAAPAIDLGELTNAPPPADSTDAVCVRYTLTLDAAATNPAQGAAIELTMAYSLTQTGAVDS